MAIEFKLLAAARQDLEAGVSSLIEQFAALGALHGDIESLFNKLTGEVGAQLVNYNGARKPPDGR